MMEEWIKPGGPLASALLAGYLLTLLLGLLAQGQRAAWRVAAVLGLAGCLALNTALIGLTWAALGRPPFKTLYETLILYPFCMAVIAFFLLALHRLVLMIPFAAAISVCALGYAVWRPDVEFVVLPPALRSAWFVPHVVTYFMAYAALFASCALALTALFKSRAGAAKGRLKAGDLRMGEEIPYEEATYRTIVFGFLALSAGLAMGAVWAKEAWGDYWSWDPKENWALISWFCYLVYLHLRPLPHWSGRRSLWVAVLSFAAVVFCYLGMNLLPSAKSSLHIYQ